VNEDDSPKSFRRAIMKKGTIVKVSEEARKGHGEYFIDQFSGNITLKKGDILYHSSDKLIKEFASGFTCFNINNYCCGYVYAIKITKDTVMRSWNAGEEVRIDLEETDTLTYIGKCIAKYDYEKKGRIGNPHVTIRDLTLKTW